MASSSTSSIHNSHDFDVFLSFRGEDTRKNFVDHLYTALEQQGIRTFKDDERLDKGKRIADDLLKAIDDSKFCLIVFSRNYASSSWCLDELVKIMESHKDTAFPIFYDVEPSEVRKQNGAVGEAFARHAGKEDAEKWRKALEEASNQSGWDVRNTENGHEARVIRLIVDFISLQSRSINIEDDENLIGMEHRMKDLGSLLEIGSTDVRMIGIKGMGGAGKTTLARAIFDKFAVRFEAKSFVENVREKSKTPLGMLKLHTQVLYDLLKEGEASSVHDATKMLKRRLWSKRVILVLDDVDRVDELRSLAGAQDWFKAGSRIIITTRDEQVLKEHKVKSIHVTLLSDEESIRLFSRYAFGRENPKSEYEIEAHEAVRYAAGLPLTIRILGSSLCGKDEDEWRDKLQRLKTIPLMETLKILELSYESLEDDYKEIFLDVACFMKGWRKHVATERLETCGCDARNGLRVLEQRSLITWKKSLDYPIEIDMHDHIKELAKNIVRRNDDPHKHSRLLEKEEIEDILADNMASEARWVDLKLTPQILEAGGLENMKKLRVLKVDCETLGCSGKDAHVMMDEVGQYLPNSLCYLSWKHYPHLFLPKTFLASNLAELSLYGGRIKQLWPDGYTKVLKKLKFLFLGSSDIKTLDLRLTPNLERLDLSSCGDLEELHLPNGCHLKRLVKLSLFFCKNLKPSLSFIKQLESLEILDLSILKLSKFPDIIPEQFNSTLLKLRLHGNDIEELPSSIGNLHKLVDLDLSRCTKLKNLPPCLYSLQHLQELDLSNSGYSDIPSSIGMLKNLKRLNVMGCRQIGTLPDELGDLECLEYLNIGYTNGKRLPDSIYMLKNLKYLRLSVCQQIESLPNSICMLKNLKLLDLSECQQIKTLPDRLGAIECLEELDIGSTNVRYLPDSICKLKHLKYLRARCSTLKHLPEDVGELECLESLDLHGCNITNLPSSVGMLKHLGRLILGKTLIDYLLENVGQLGSLTTLDLVGCNIRNLPSSICMLKNLEVLNIRDCKLLEELPDKLGDIECLRRLDISGSGIRHLPLPHSISLLLEKGDLEIVDYVSH